jgi:peroxiredoxin
VPETHREYYQRILVNIPFVNSGNMYKDAAESSWRLPLPAVFVVQKGGNIVYSEAHADFRVRPEPADVLAAVASCL